MKSDLFIYLFISFISFILLIYFIYLFIFKKLAPPDQNEFYSLIEEHSKRMQEFLNKNKLREEDLGQLIARLYHVEVFDESKEDIEIEEVI